MAGIVPFPRRVPSGHPDGDRRGAPRYAIQVALEYRLFLQRRPVAAGRGHTMNLSSTGILFESSQTLPARCTIELAIEWPVRLDDRIALTMCVHGRTVWTDGTVTAVRIRRYECRIRGGDAMAGALVPR